MREGAHADYPRIRADRGLQGPCRPTTARLSIHTFAIRVPKAHLLYWGRLDWGVIDRRAGDWPSGGEESPLASDDTEVFPRGLGAGLPNSAAVGAVKARAKPSSP